jgi:hypothetical protein
MSNLGNLYFTLGLDDSKFKDGIEAAKKAVQELNGKIDIDMSPVTRAIRNVEEDAVRLNSTLRKSLTLNFGVDDLQRTLNLEKMKGLEGDKIREAERMIREFQQAIKEAGSDAVKLDELSNKFKRLKTEIGFLVKEQKAYNSEVKKADTKRAAQELERQKDAALGAEGSIYRLEAALRDLKDAYRKLSQTDRDSVFGQDLLNRINQADAELTSINSKMANNAELSRKFGQQYDGIFVQTQQLIRELPSATISLQQFLLAISNNLPLFADELSKANAKVKEMKANGEEVTPVWKQLVKALFSWQSALMLAIVAATAYGDEIASFVKGLFKAEEGFDGAAEAAKNFAEAMKEGRQDAEGELSVLRKLYSTATDTAESMDERTAAVKHLKEQYPDYLKDLSDEAILSGEASTAYDKLTASIIATAKARAAMEKITENSRKSLDIEEDVTSKQAEIEKLNVEYGELQAKIKAVEETTSDPTALKGNTLLASLRQSATEIGSKILGIEKDIAERRDEIQALSQANEKLSKSVKVTDLLGDVEDDEPDTPTNKYISLYEQAKEIEKAEQVIKDAVSQSRRNLQKNGIALLKDGNEKELAQINLDYDNKIAAIKKREAELLQALQDEDYKIWKQQNPDYKERNLQFKSTISALPEANAADFAKEYQQAAEYRQQQTDALLNKTIAKYQDFADKKKAIEEKFNADIKLLEQNRNKENGMVINKAIILARQEMKEALQELADDEARAITKDNNFLKLLFGDISSMSFDALSTFIAQARQLKEYLSGSGDSEGITFISEEQLKAITSSPEELEKLQKALDKILYPNKKETVWNQIFDDFKTGFASLNSAKGFNEISGAIGTISGAAATAANNLAEMFSQMGLEDIAEIVEGLGQIMNSVANIGQGFAKGGLVGGIAAIVAETTNIIGKAFAANARHKAALREIMNQSIQQQREYNLLLLEQNLLYERASTIFGADLYGKASNAAKVLSDANKALQRELKGLSSLEIVTGHKKTGLFGWGKGKDVYSSILSIYPDLLDKSGKFNKELAETIINTRKMTDEDKAALQNLIDLSEQVEEAFTEMKDYLTDIFGDLGNTMLDAMVSAFDSGTDAAQKYIESVSDMLATLAKQMIYSVTLAPIIEQAQEKMMEISKNTRMTDEAKFKAYSHILDGLVEGAVAEQENAQKLWESYKKAAEAYGFDISQKGSGSDGLSKGVQSITESQADLLSSYVNGMRADLSVIRSIMEKGGYSIGAAVEMIDYTSQISEANTQLFALVSQGSEMSLIAQSQLNSLNQIVSNTSRNAIAAEKISVASANIEGLLNRVIDKGSNKLKV